MRLPALGWGAGAGLLVVLLLAPFAGTALGKLATARREHAALQAEVATPASAAPLLDPGLAFRAIDEAGARGTMLARVQALSKSGGVLVEETSAVRAPAGTAALRLRVSGAEKAVIAFADGLERSRALIRFRTWRLEPVAGGTRLSGEIVAVWQ